MPKKKQKQKTEKIVLPPHWGQIFGALQQIQTQRQSRIIDPKNPPGQKTLPLPLEAILLALAEISEAMRVHTELLGALGKSGSVSDFQKAFKRHYRPVNPADVEEEITDGSVKEDENDEQPVPNAEE